MEVKYAQVSLREGTKVENRSGDHTWITDEPADKGGTDLGPTPKELLLGALGSCIAVTLRIYCDRKGYNLKGVDVDLSWDGGKVEVDGKMVNRTIIAPKVTIHGDFDDEVRETLTKVATRCPVHVALGQGVHFGGETIEFEPASTTA